MTAPFPHNLEATRAAQLGLVVLQSDETIEMDFRALLPPEIELFVSRVPSSPQVTSETLAAMEGHLGQAASLFPQAAKFEAVGYGCTSGSAQIGPARVAELIKGATQTKAVTNPLTALVAACRHLGVTRLGMLSPYIAQVSQRLQEALADEGIDTPVFGSFDVAEEARVVRIDTQSIITAAESLAKTGGIDALFLSCTNLRTLAAIAPLEAQLGLPVLSSNQVLAWHMLRETGQSAAPSAPGQLFKAP